MKLFFLFITLFTTNCFAQTINHPSGKTSAIATIKQGKTYHYFDDGGLTGNYSVGINSLVTFYPEKKGEFVSFTCNSIEVASDCRMYFFDGNHSGAPILKYLDFRYAKNSLSIGEIITASAENPSGAITVKFVHSKQWMPKAGWDLTVSTSNSPGAAPKKTTQDCSGAIKVCSDDQITTKSSGAGVQELPGPKFWNIILNYGKNGENQSNWYKFEVATPGTIEFIIKPRTPTDFDWALWGPYSAHECPVWNNHKPIRLSAAEGDNSKGGITGLSGSAYDKYEDSPGDGFVMPLTVRKGEHYVLMIDDWSGNNTTFDLKWLLLNGASLECKKDEAPPETPDEKDIVVEIIDTTVEVEIDCTDKIQTEANISDAELGKPGKIKLITKGEGTPLTFKWYDSTGKEVSRGQSLLNAGVGKYSVEIMDANGCKLDKVFTVGIKELESIDLEPKLEANLSQDQSFVTVSYPGAFEYKIENMDEETVVTGHSVDTDEVEITRLPPGRYRVSLIYKKIKQYTEFVKE